MTTMSSRLGGDVPVRSPEVAARPLLAGPAPWLALLLGVLLLRVVAMHGVVLVPEEAYYWLYAENPQLSYFDHPPMVAWVIRAGTLLLGETQLGVRLVGDVMIVAASIPLYLFGRMWFGRTAALLGAAAIQVLPVYYGAGLIATMDAPLVFFWSLGLLGFSVALKHGRPSGWYLAGAAAGAAMLSKYTGVFLGMGAALCVVGHAPWRRHLRSVHPFLAAALAAAIFSPVVAWNAQHDWASFRFQFIDRFAGRGVGVGTVLGFVGVQFAVATPVVLAGVAWLVRRPLRGRRLTPAWWMAAAFCLPLLAALGYKSLRSDIHMNWMLPVYLSAMPAAARLALVENRRRRMRRAAGRRPDGLRWTAGVCLGVNAAIAVFLLVIQPRVGLVSAFGPWADLAAVVEECEDRVEEEIGAEPAIIGGGKYRLASVLAFYRVPIEDEPVCAEQTTSQWIIDGRQGLGFEYWSTTDDWLGRTCIYIDDRAELPPELLECFESVEPVADPRLAAMGHEMAICRGYRGPSDAPRIHPLPSPPPPPSPSGAPHPALPPAAGKAHAT